MSAAGTCTGIFKGHQLLHHFTCTSCTLSFYWGLVEFCFLTNYAFIQKKLGGIKKLITSFRWPKKLSIFGEIQLFWFNVHCTFTLKVSATRATSLRRFERSADFQLTDTHQNTFAPIKHKCLRFVCRLL